MLLKFLRFCDIFREIFFVEKFVFIKLFLMLFSGLLFVNGIWVEIKFSVWGKIIIKFCLRVLKD